MSFAYGLHVWKSSSQPPACCCMSGWAAVEYVTFCCCLWWISYWFILLVTKQSDEWSCRFLALCHGCTVVFSALLDIIVNEHETGFQNCSLTEYQKNYLSYMLSYFLFDFIWIHLYGNETWIIYFHHLASIVILLKVLVSDYGGVYISYGAAGLEFTNPYLQCRWFLRTHGYRNNPIHKLVELWFFVAFFVIRLIGGSVIAYRITKCKGVDLFMKSSILAIYFISWVLAWQIFMVIKKKYWNRRHGSQTSIQNTTSNRIGSPTGNGSLSATSQQKSSRKGSLSATSQQKSSRKGSLSETSQQKSSRKGSQTNETEESVQGPSESN